MDAFERIDMENWPRAEVYRLYTEVWGTVTYTLTKKLSVEKLVPYLKERGIKFVPAVMWLVSREVNRIENFRLAIHEGNLGTWEVVHPIFPTLNATQNMTFHSLHHREHFRDFYEAYLVEQAENRDKTRLWANRIPRNFFMVSIFPWLHFDASSMTMHKGRDYHQPFLAIGQYNEDWELPVMLMGNHASTDAWHASEFFRGLQEGFDHPELGCH